MDQINAKEMEKIVREAGMYEENMSREEIRTYYGAITDSKTTATTEDETRDFTDHQIDSYEELELVPSQENSRSNSIEDDKSNDVELEILDACKANITFQDMQSIPREKCLSICYHPLKYENIQNSKMFLEADDDTKAKMLYSYHTKMAKLRADLSRKSFFTVPLPKPIILSEMHISQSSFDSDVLDTYISRSGRQTKRKLYNEDDDSNSGTLSIKKKNIEVDWISKSKPLIKSSTSKGNDVLTEVIKTHNSDSHYSSTPKSSTNTTKKLTNKEIIEKSKLFDDFPPKISTPKNLKATETYLKSIPKSKRLTRSDEMFKKMIKDTEKKQSEETQLEDFKGSLEVSDEETLGKNEPDNEDIIIMDDEPTRRRVLPPIPLLSRRNIHSNGAGPSIETSDSSRKENLAKKRGKSKGDSSKSIGYADSTKNDDEPDLSDVPCPMCNKSFPVDKIQTHAATCGEEEVVPKYYTRKTVLCNICDKVFESNYEEHVKECIKSHNKI